MMKTLLFATAAVMALAAAAAPASARARHGHYYGQVVTRTGEGVTGGGYDLSGPGGTGVYLGTRSYGYVARRYRYGAVRGGARAVYGYVPYNYAVY
jgi:hypothetical protein